MAGRKLKPIEGDVCWFCKQPADAGSWMDLGDLKSTQEPVYEGTHYILYHEPCAVYSNGANVSLTGMDDQTVLQFWLHGERCSGIGLKCQLCGLRGATTGCLHGPCQQFYHYPCARVRAFQGHLQFSRTCRALACEKHLALLPHPAEEDFLGMWMEGEGGWNGSYKQQASSSWQPHYTAYIADFQNRWQHLLTMLPLEQRKAEQQQEKKKGRRRSSKGGKASADGGDSDPEFRVGRSGRSGHTGGKPKGAKQQQKQQQQQQQGSKEGVASPRAQQQQQVPQRVGVPPEIAQAAVRQQQALSDVGAGGVGDDRSSERVSQDGASGQQQLREGQHVTSGAHANTDLLLRAAGFTTSASPTAQQQDGSSVQLPEQSDALHTALSGEHSAQEVTAALVAAVVAAAGRNGSSSRTASSAAKAAAALRSGASSADSAPAHKEPGRAAATADAPAGDTEPAGDAGQEVASTASPAAATAPASLESPTSAGPMKRCWAGTSAGGEFPVRRTAPYTREAAEAAAAAAAARAAAAAATDGGAGQKDQSDSSMQGVDGGTHEEPAVAADGDAAAAGAASGSRAGGHRHRRYLDVNTYAAMGQKVLTHEPELDAASQQRRQTAASGGKQPHLLSSSAVPAAVAAPNLPGWPGNRGVDMFSWLQQQVRQQPGLAGRGVNGSDLPAGKLDPTANGTRHLGALPQPRASAVVAGNGGHNMVSSNDAVQQAADAVAAAAAKLGSGVLEGPQKEQLLATVQALTHSAQRKNTAAARESSTQVPQVAMQSPLQSPRLVLGGSSASAAGSSDTNNLVPAVAELLRVLGAQMSGQQPSAGQDSMQQQQRSSLKRPRSMDQYMGIEAANAAAAAAASGSFNALSSPKAAAVGGLESSQLLPQTPEYYGCVTSLPALQPGELRAGGVTAHPNVVAMYVKQDPRKALTLQPWSIVVPPSALRQLRSSHIEPSHLASQLYQLLHASNVLNHHSTNATAAAGGGRGSGSGSMGVSGGYAGMPQDFPVRFVQGCMVPDDDARSDLRGEFTLTAMQDIEAGTIIGPWRCYVLTQDDYSRLQRRVPPDWQGPDSGRMRGQAWVELLHRYTLPVKVPFLATDDPYGKVLASNAPMLYLCALGFGNLTCLVNDPALNPMAAALGADAAAIAMPNVDLCVVLVNGLPLPVLISTREIRQGQELLCSYGKGYWQTWHSMREDTAAVAHNASGQQQRLQGV